MMESIRIAGVARESIVDGPGIRFTLFVQGCPHHCPGCHNPETHDPDGGKLVAAETILTEFDKNPLLRGITLSGGDPIPQAEALLPLVREIVSVRGKDCVVYSGSTFTELQEMGKHRPAILELLSLSILLVDGPFVLGERDLSLQFRGSRNQRLLDPKASLAAGKAIWVNWATDQPQENDKP